MPNLSRAVWSLVGLVVTVPRRTTRPVTSRTLQPTCLAAPLPEPGVASGAGVTRVQMITPSGS